MHLPIHHQIKILTLTTCLIGFFPQSYAFLPLSYHAFHSGGFININASRCAFTCTEKNKSMILLVSQNENDANSNHESKYQQNHQTIPAEEMIEIPSQMPLLLPITTCIPSQMSPTSLAYIGDVVYEMCIRCRYVWPSRRTSDLQNVVVAKVRAETQSTLFHKLIESFSLTSEEHTIISRGRNAGSPKKKSRGPKRLYGAGGKGQGPSVYQDSTALEALIGYLYLSDRERCHEVLEFFSDILNEMDEEEGIVR